MPTVPAPSDLRLLNVHAHPDDESSKGAATMAKYVAEGARVMVATFTGGERGSILNPTFDSTGLPDELTEVRHGEMAKAASILGVEHVWLGFVDSGLPEGDPLPPLPEGCFALLDADEAAIPLVALIRDFRPQVMTTYDELGGYPHPDHIQTHVASMRAFELAADPSFRPDLGAPWQIAKVYYHMNFHRLRFAALDAAMHEEGLESPFGEWLAMREDNRADERITTRVPASDYFHVRDDALRAHATQVDPNGFWFAAPLSVQQRAWPTEDFQLVFSTVPTFIPEDDLFAGLRDGGEHAYDPSDAWMI